VIEFINTHPFYTTLITLIIFLSLIAIAENIVEAIVKNRALQKELRLYKFTLNNLKKIKGVVSEPKKMHRDIKSS
jgi:hypothetical protein